MKKKSIVLGMTMLLAGLAEAQFQSGQLAVLRVGDNGTGAASNLGNKQAPVFIDQFDPNVPNGTNLPLYSVAIPTNDPVSGPPAALWINGQAATEGNLARSGDLGTLAFTGYGGNIEASPGTPAQQAIPRGICVVDAFGDDFLAYEGNAWYGITGGKTNPRGVVSDNGTNNFWGCGSVYGTLWYNPDYGVEEFQNFTSTRAVKIINNILYTSIQASDAANNLPAGIYNFVDFNNNPVPLPEGDASFPNLVIPATPPYTSTVGFDMNPEGTIAYMADTVLGIQKYIQSGGSWRLACNFAIPANTNSASNPQPSLTGCFGLAVDFSGAFPILYATTTEGYGGNINSNRIIRINDTNSITSGVTITNPVINVATAWSTNIAFRGLAFAPDLRPVITTNPTSLSLVAGTLARFSVSATANEPILYQWQENGGSVAGQTNAVLTFDTTLSDNGTMYQCVVSDSFGAVTSSPPALLTVTASAVAPSIIGPVQNLTNAIGDFVTMSVNASGTDPLSYQWYQNGNLLTNANEFSGTATGTLAISEAQPSDAGSYSVAVSNSAGTTSNLVATLTLVPLAPIIILSPGATTTVLGGNTSFTVNAFGTSLTYQWYEGKSLTSHVTPLSDVNEFSGTGTPTLNIMGAQFTDATNYFVVVGSTSSSITVTSALAALSVVVAPPSSFVAYTNAGQIYAQNFDALPIPNGVSYNAANPITMSLYNPSNGAIGNVTYSLNTPFDFAFPTVSSGSIGGLGLSRLSGWYGWAVKGAKIAVQEGDQSTGGIIDFGGPYSGLPIAENVTNRALGLLASGSTGGTAFALKLINQTSNTFAFINLQYTGELWRQEPDAQILSFGYTVDPAGTNSVFTPDVTSWVTNLNVEFPTDVSGVEVLDGTQPENQIHLNASNLAITNWPPGAALWLSWQMTNSVGGGQGLAIDDFGFSATVQPAVALTIAQSNNNVILSWPVSATGFSLQYNADLSQSNGWAVASQPVLVTNQSNTVTVPMTNQRQFFRLAP